MEFNFLDKIISGFYSNWFFDVFMANIAVTIKNNLPILMIFSYYFLKISKLTNNTWDDKAAEWLHTKVNKAKDNGGRVTFEYEKKDGTRKEDTKKGKEVEIEVTTKQWTDKTKTKENQDVNINSSSKKRSDDGKEKRNT